MDPCLGTTVTETIDTAADTITFTKTAMGEDAYPFKVLVQARDKPAYIGAQGASLDATAANNCLLAAGEYQLLMVHSDAQATLNFKRSSGSGTGTLSVTVVGRSR